MTTHRPDPDTLPTTDLLLDQLTWHWDSQLRPRLAGLGDDEYAWEPAPGCWSIRPRGTSSAPVQAGVGEVTIDFALPEPDPAPVTTIAWRLAHLVVGVLAVRSAAHFGGPGASYEGWEYAATAAQALDQLDTELQRWRSSVAAAGPEWLAAPCGPAEGPWAKRSHAELVLHLNRELIHHGAEVCLLRDLFRATADGRVR